RVLSDYRHSGVPPAEAGLLDFALKLCRDGASVSRADISELHRQGWTDAVILETVLVAAWARFESCVSAGVGASPDFPPISIPPRAAFLVQPSVARQAVEPGPFLPSAELNPDRFTPFA